LTAAVNNRALEADFHPFERPKNTKIDLQDKITNDELTKSIKQSSLKIRFIKNDLKTLIETEADIYITLEDGVYREIHLQADEIPVYFRINLASKPSPVTLSLQKYQKQDIKLFLSTAHKYPGKGCEHSFDENDYRFYGKNKNYDQKVHFSPKGCKAHE